MAGSGATDARNVPKQPPADDDSLDFTEPEETTSAAPPRARRPRPKPAKTEAPPKRSAALLILGVLAAALAYLMWDPAPQQVTATRPSAQTPAPAPGAPKSPQAGTPAPQAVAPAPASATKAAVTPTLPPEFLKLYGDHAKKAGGKAIALALANDGRWAYGAVSGYAAQADANEEAMVECRLYKIQAGVSANCRLYAVGDNVVW